MGERIVIGVLGLAVAGLAGLLAWLLRGFAKSLDDHFGGW